MGIKNRTEFTVCEMCFFYLLDGAVLVLSCALLPERLVDAARAVALRGSCAGGGITAALCGRDIGFLMSVPGMRCSTTLPTGRFLKGVEGGIKVYCCALLWS
jgi:hypothetical protein